MSGDVKVGDRFEHSRTGGVAVCTGAQVTDSERYPCEFKARGKEPYPAECYLDEPYWRRLPREAASVGPPLRLGDQITSGDMLATGMRIHVSPLGDYIVRERERLGWSVGPDGQWIADSSWGQSDTLPVTFRGWGQEEKAGEREWEAIRPIENRFIKPDPTPTGLRCSHMLPWGGQCVLPEGYHFFHVSDVQQGGWQPEPQPAPPPKALPFKYLGWCSQKAQHDGKTLCLTCEGLIAEREACRFETTAEPHRPEPHRPSDTGLGSVVGPILSRMR